MASTIQKAIFEALAACLGLSSSSAAASALIRAAYADPENQPQPPRTRNVICFYLQQEEDTFSRRIHFSCTLITDSGSAPLSADLG